MSRTVKYLPDAEKDLKDLDGSQRILVLKMTYNKLRKNMNCFKDQ